MALIAQNGVAFNNRQRPYATEDPGAMSAVVRIQPALVMLDDISLDIGSIKNGRTAYVIPTAKRIDSTTTATRCIAVNNIAGDPRGGPVHVAPDSPSVTRIATASHNRFVITDYITLDGRRCTSLATNSSTRIIHYSAFCNCKTPKSCRVGFIALKPDDAITIVSVNYELFRIRYIRGFNSNVFIAE